MTYSDDFRWRAIALVHIYGISISIVSELLGPKQRSIRRWYASFRTNGTTDPKNPRQKSSRWPPHVIKYVSSFVKEHPTFYIDELKAELETNFPSLPNVSTSTICRALNFDLKLSRKVLTKAAREALPHEIINYKKKLSCIYSYPEQLVFIDETSKDGRHAQRRYAWSLRNTKAVVKLPFSRGERLSIIAALDCTGFIGWETTEGTFTRESFHKAFVKHVVPKLNPWPLPRSILVLDNAKIHLYKELENVIHQCGARLLFLPPYSPELNPIELCFGRLKEWIQKHANLTFPLYPKAVLEVAMRYCTKVH